MISEEQKNDLPPPDPLLTKEGGLGFMGLLMPANARGWAPNREFSSLSNPKKPSKIAVCEHCGDLPTQLLNFDSDKDACQGKGSRLDPLFIKRDSDEVMEFGGYGMRSANGIGDAKLARIIIDARADQGELTREECKATGLNEARCEAVRSEKPRRRSEKPRRR